MLVIPGTNFTKNFRDLCSTKNSPSIVWEHEAEALNGIWSHAFSWSLAKHFLEVHTNLRRPDTFPPHGGDESGSYRCLSCWASAKPGCSTTLGDALFEANMSTQIISNIIQYIIKSLSMQRFEVFNLGFPSHCSRNQIAKRQISTGTSSDHSSKVSARHLLQNQRKSMSTLSETWIRCE